MFHKLNKSNKTVLRASKIKRFKTRRILRVNLYIIRQLKTIKVKIVKIINKFRSHNKQILIQLKKIQHFHRILG